MKTKYNQSFTLFSRFIALLALASAMMVANVSLAQTDITWNNTTAHLWATAGNWSPANIPDTAGENAVFGTVGSDINISETINGTIYSMQEIGLNANETIGQLHFKDKVSGYNGWHIYDSTAHTLTVSGNNAANPVILQDSGCTAAILVYSAGHTPNLALGKSGGNTIQVDGTVLEIQCPIINGNGVNSLTKTGAGTLVLDGANTYSGGTTIASGGGTLKITNPGALGAGSVTIQKSVNNSGTLQLALTGNNTIANTFNGFAGTTFKDGAVACIQNVSGVNKITSDLTVTSTGGAGMVIQSDADSIELSGTIGSSISDNVRGVELTGAGNGLVSGLVQDTGGYAFNLQKYGAGTWTLTRANTYSGDTTISAGTLKLDTGGTLANTANITVASGAGFDVSTPTTALTLGSGQTLKADATGANATGTITVANNKNLTLGGTTIGLQFTAYGGGSTAPLTVTGSSAGSLALNSKPVTVYTTSQLAAGAYKLIAKSGSATVSGTPGTLSVTGSGVVSGATPTLQVVSGELYLYVPGISAAATLTGNISSTYGAPANPASVSVSGSGLSGNLTVTAQTGYQVCLTSGGSYTSSLTLTPSGGAVTATTVYVEFTSTKAAANYNSATAVALTSTGAATVNVATTSSGNTVSKATASVTVTPYSVTYDGNPHSATVVSTNGV
ncbi:MAG: autotransporter-associated beta strand repeat-containing protein, partial [Verrucomicrobiae bacterium]